jgi:hypothetical protein
MVGGGRGLSPRRVRRLGGVLDKRFGHGRVRVGYSRTRREIVCVYLDGHEIGSLLPTWTPPAPGSRQEHTEMARMRMTVAARRALRPRASTALAVALTRRPVARARENRPRRCRSASSRAGPGDDGPGDPPGRAEAPGSTSAWVVA